MLGKKRLCALLVFTLLALARPAPAQEPQSPPCTPVAKLFETVICAEDITTEKAHIEAIRQQYEEQGLDSDAALQTRSAERLRDIIWATALTHKFGAAATEPAQHEIELFSNTFRESLDRSHKENLEAAARIKTLLASGQYEGEKGQRLRSLLASIQTSISFYEERESHKEKMPPEFHNMVAEAERGLAEKMMRNWKTSKALYEEYGGRLVVRDGAVEPVDALGAFLSYIKKTGGLQILDPAYKDVFRELELFIAAKHEPLPAEEYGDYFASPERQFENSASKAAR